MMYSSSLLLLLPQESYTSWLRHFPGTWSTKDRLYTGDSLLGRTGPVSILYKSRAGSYRPVSYPDGPITARYRFIKNAVWGCAYRDRFFSFFEKYTPYLKLTEGLAFYFRLLTWHMNFAILLVQILKVESIFEKTLINYSLQRNRKLNKSVAN